MASRDGDRAYALGGGLALSVAFNNDAGRHRVLRGYRKRRFAAPAVFLGRPGPAYLRADSDLAVALRHVPGDRSCGLW